MKNKKPSSIFNQIDTTQTNSNSQPLTMASLKKVMDDMRKIPVIREVKMHDDLWLINITGKQPFTKLDQLYGVPIVVDPDMPAGKAKFIFSDGREQEIDVHSS
jgi:hypothetical protein